MLIIHLELLARNVSLYHYHLSQPKPRTSIYLHHIAGQPSVYGSIWTLKQLDVLLVLTGHAGIAGFEDEVAANNLMLRINTQPSKSELPKMTS